MRRLETTRVFTSSPFFVIACFNLDKPEAISHERGLPARKREQIEEETSGFGGKPLRESDGVGLRTAYYLLPTETKFHMSLTLYLFDHPL